MHVIIFDIKIEMYLYSKIYLQIISHSWCPDTWIPTKAMVAMWGLQMGILVA